jgi:hypothetical protein
VPRAFDEKTHAVDRYMGVIAAMEACDKKYVNREVQGPVTFKKARYHVSIPVLRVYSHRSAEYRGEGSCVPRQPFQTAHGRGRGMRREKHYIE